MKKTNNAGITLIALVITIIVLLILAGISIAMLTGSNGILTKANEADAETVRAEARERINLALDGVYTDLLTQRYVSGAEKELSDLIIKTENGLGEAMDKAMEKYGEFKVTPVNKDAGNDEDVVTITFDIKDEKNYGQDISGSIKGSTASQELPYKVFPATDAAE